MEIIFRFTLVDLNFENLHYELSWIFTNLCSLNSAFVIDNVLSPQFVIYLNQLIEHPKMNIADNALHCFANLTGDQSTVEFVLNQTNLVAYIKKALESEKIKIKIVRKLSWIIGNIGIQAQYLMSKKNEMYEKVLGFGLEKISNDLV